MSDVEILRAFMTRLNTYVTTLPSLPIAYLDKQYDGQAFSPPDSGMWLEGRYFPGEIEDRLWNEDRPIQIGFFQVSVYFRNDVTEPRATDEASSIIAHFPKGYQINDEIRIRERPTRGAKVTLEDFSFIPITIRYYGIGE